MASSDQWGEVTARIDKDNGVHVSTHGIEDLALDRDAEHIDDAAPVTLGIDQSKLVFQAGQAIEAHRDGGAWKAGPAVHAARSSRQRDRADEGRLQRADALRLGRERS